MTTTTPTLAVNGVNTEALFGTLDAVRNQPDLARFQFRTTTQWISGTHNRTTVNDFHGAGGEHTHVSRVLHRRGPPGRPGRERQRPYTC